jgi:hypothetical protein
MKRDARRRKNGVTGAALVGLIVPGAFLAAWQRIVEDAVCESTAALGCVGPALLLIVVGVPISYVGWSFGLALTGAALPWLAPLAIFGCMVVLVPLAAPLAVPNPAWLAFTSVTSATWAWAAGKTP